MMAMMAMITHYLAAAAVPPPLASVAVFSLVPPSPSCDTLPVLKEGAHIYSCSAGDPDWWARITYTVSTPATCVRGGCGVVMDVHGLDMTAAMQEQSDNFQVLGNDAGYIVIQPTAPKDMWGIHAWSPLVHFDQLLLFFRYAVATFKADLKRVHIMGYSEGGFAAWNILCKAPDLICSAAPLEASALDWWGPGYGTGGCFSWPAKGPSISRSILFTNGITDPLSVIANARQQVANVQRAWGLTPSAATLTSGFKFTSQSWQQPSRNFTYLEHDYSITNSAADGLKGHCFPTTAADGCKMSWTDPVLQCCGAFTWARHALAFFQANPCQPTAALVV